MDRFADAVNLDYVRQIMLQIANGIELDEDQLRLLARECCIVLGWDAGLDAAQEAD